MKIKANILRSGTRQVCLLSSLLFILILEVLVGKVSKEKEIKAYRLGKKK